MQKFQVQTVGSLGKWVYGYIDCMVLSRWLYTCEGNKMMITYIGLSTHHKSPSSRVTTSMYQFSSISVWFARRFVNSRKSSMNLVHKMFGFGRKAGIHCFFPSTDCTKVTPLSELWWKFVMTADWWNKDHPLRRKLSGWTLSWIEPYIPTSTSILTYPI